MGCWARILGPVELFLYTKHDLNIDVTRDCKVFGIQLPHRPFDVIVNLSAQRITKKTDTGNLWQPSSSYREER